MKQLTIKQMSAANEIALHEAGAAYAFAQGNMVEMDRRRFVADAQRFIAEQCLTPAVWKLFANMIPTLSATMNRNNGVYFLDGRGWTFCDVKIKTYILPGWQGIEFTCRDASDARHQIDAVLTEMRRHGHEVVWRDQYSPQTGLPIYSDPGTGSPVINSFPEPRVPFVADEAGDVTVYRESASL